MINIVFDFGAVLFNWRPELLVRKVFAREAATAIAATDLAATIFHHPDWQEFDRGTVQLQVVADRTASRLGLPRQALHELMSDIPQYLTPIRETVELLDQLRQRRDARADLRLYYLSNMPAPFARELEQRHRFLDWFDGGVFSGDVRLIKPQPEIYQLLESRFALQADQTVFVDDLPANVQAARVHGWHGIQFESAAHLAPQLIAHTR